MQWSSAFRAAALPVILYATLASIGSATAQTWPTRPVKLIVSLGPGSAVDIIARLVAERLTARWSQPLVVENRPGGDSVIAIKAVIGASDDHTLLYMPTASYTAHPYEHEKLPYDPRDLLPVARVSKALVGIAVSPSLNAGSVAELIALIRTQPGKLNYSTGTGMTDIIFGGYFKSAGLAITRVPYRDVVTPMTDLAEGRIHAAMYSLGILQPHVLAGRAKLIAVTNSERASLEPDVPTVAQAGFPALTFEGLSGVFGPRTMAPAVRQRIATDIREVLADPAIALRITAIGQVVSPGNAAEFAASIEEQRAKLAAIAKLPGNKP